MSNPLKIKINKDTLYRLALGHFFTFTEGDTEVQVSFDKMNFKEIREAIDKAERNKVN